MLTPFTGHSQQHGNKLCSQQSIILTQESVNISTDPRPKSALILPKPPTHEKLGKADCCSLRGFPVKAYSQTRREATYHTGL